MGGLLTNGKGSLKLPGVPPLRRRGYFMGYRGDEARAVVAQCADALEDFERAALTAQTDGGEPGRQTHNLTVVDGGERARPPRQGRAYNR